MTKKMNIAVLFGGRSGEHDVSLMSARSVLDNLNTEEYDVFQIGITNKGVWLTGENVIEAFTTNSFDHLYPVVLPPEPKGGALYMIRNNTLEALPKIDVIFPVLHGTFGEDGTMQGLLELADVAYVGCGVLASSVGMDKSLFKDVMRANDIPVVDSILTSRTKIASSIEEVIHEVEQKYAYPVFVKPVNLGSSVGISKCSNRSDLLEGLMDAARYDRRVLVETGIDAHEIEVSVLGNDEPEASVAGEIRPMEEFYSYEAKYIHGTSELTIPAKIDQPTMEKIRAYAVKAFKAIDGAGMARVDFLLERITNQIYLNEVNTIPGFTNISMYAKLWAACGISYPQLIDRLIKLALERKTDRDQTERIFRSNE